MRNYKNILVAIDCSAVDDAVIDHASALARQLHSTLHLLHVVHSHTLDQERILRQQSATILDGYRKKIESEGVNVRVVIRSGEPESEILGEIEERGYDLLAMATHGHGLTGRILFGSVSRTLRQKIPIPLLLIKPDR